MIQPSKIEYEVVSHENKLKMLTLIAFERCKIQRYDFKEESSCYGSSPKKLENFNILRKYFNCGKKRYCANHSKMKFRNKKLNLKRTNTFLNNLFSFKYDL